MITHSPPPRPLHTADHVPSPSSSSPPTSPSRARRPSISNTMHWLSRSSTQNSSTGPYSPSKPIRISEPKLIRSIELLSSPRSGVLGAGATVVRTPDEALRDASVGLTPHDRKPSQERSPTPPCPTTRTPTTEEKTRGRTPHSPPPTSPPLPPLPMSEEDEPGLLTKPEPQSLVHPSKPIRSPPTFPIPSPRPSLISSPSRYTEDQSHVLPASINISQCPPPPPFKPILLSEVPSAAIDPSKIIVTLETSTATHKITLDSLKSRPSHLSQYISLFLPSRRNSVTSSLYSSTSEDKSAYQRYLTSQGLMPQAVFSMHIFLDRNSSSYTHVLNYLRSLVGAPNAAGSLPRSIQIQDSHLRLESLLDLRDEAAYLGLEELQSLCIDEIHRYYGSRLHVRGQGVASSLHGSISSTHTLLNQSEYGMRPKSASSNSNRGSNDAVISQKPPTPRSHPVSTPPAGWI